MNSKYILKSTLTPRPARKDMGTNLQKSRSCSSLEGNKSQNPNSFNNYLTVHVSISWHTNRIPILWINRINIFEFCWIGRLQAYNPNHHDHAEYGRSDSREWQQYQRQYGTVVQFDNITNKWLYVARRTKRKTRMDNDDTTRDRLLDWSQIARPISKCIFSI